MRTGCMLARVSLRSNPSDDTIAPRDRARGVINFVVTLATLKDPRSYP